MGTTAARQPMVLDQGRSQKPALSGDTHHPCLGSGRALPYSADRGKKSVSRHALDELKQQIPLLDYLQAHDWRPARQLTRGRLMGLCPLHEDHQPSFLLDPHREPVLLLQLRSRRGRDSLRRTVSPGELPTGAVAAPPMAGLGAVAGRSRELLSHAVTPSQRGSRLPVSTRSQLTGTDRAYADRLRTWWLLASLAGRPGLPGRGSAASRPR